jgi:restriction system protein
MFLKNVAGATPSLAPIVAMVLLMFALVSAVGSWRNRKNTHSRSSRTSPRAYSPQSLSRKPTVGRNHGISDINTDTKHTESARTPIEFHPPAPLRDGVTKPKPTKKGIDLSAKTLGKMEWYSFELLCKIYYESVGYRVTKTKAGADGGVDLLLYQKDCESPHALVQCKARASRDIGVSYIRELLGVMTADKVQKGILITNSCFTKEAIKLAQSQPIEAIDVYKLATLVNELDERKKSKLVQFLESTDYTTPTCPNCEMKLVERVAKKGKDVGQKFWGCRNYPRCHYKLQMNKTGLDRRSACG